MVLRLYNTLTKAKEEFTPLDRKNVRLYVCGPTVYDFAHIGNARPAIVFDVLFRLLRILHGEDRVTYVRNITDVDDKINARAAEEFPGQPLNESIRRITEKTETQYHDDIKALGCLPPTFEPRATEHIGEMIAMIERLIANGHAYAAEGHVLFDVPSKADYGKLARRSLDEMIAGARVDVAPYKKNPMDFVLWKPSKPGEPSWRSPWSDGRPGWHIECSAMSETLLGETFDIHGGGIDLVFPHHENEIAQSEGVHQGHPLARIWMHNGFLQVEGEKMSKSLGNFLTIHGLLKDWPGEVLRLTMLKTHYRQPIDWTVASLRESESLVEKWRKLFGSQQPEANPSPISRRGRFWDALRDDLNTPQAITELHALHQKADSGREMSAILRLKKALSDLGFDSVTVPKPESSNLSLLVRLSLKKDIEARNTARQAKNFKEADRIRDELLAKGIVLKDNADGTTSWETKR